MEKIQVWYDREEVKESRKVTLYVSLENFRGNILLLDKEWRICLFLTPREADNLAFAINSNLQTLEMERKELENGT